MGLYRAAATTSICAHFLETYVTSKLDESVERGSQLAQPAAVMPVLQLLS